MPAQLDAIQQRYACRQFAVGQADAEGELDLVREAGRLAPSGFGLEPWRFITLADSAQRAAVVHACYDQPAAATAAAFIVIVALLDALDPDSDYVRARFEAEARGQDTAPIHESYRAFYRAEGAAAWARGQCNFAAAHMLLQAGHLRLGSCPIGGFDEAALTPALRARQDARGRVPVEPRAPRARGAATTRPLRHRRLGKGPRDLSTRHDDYLAEAYR